VFGLFEKTDEKTKLTELIDEHLTSMTGIGLETEEATTTVNNLKVLMETRKIESEIDRSWRPSADTVVTVAGSLLGIVSILTFEKANIISSKALNFVMKPKI
jgi:hypothetical protein